MTIFALINLVSLSILILSTQANELRKIDFYQGYAYNSTQQFSRSLDKTSPPSAIIEDEYLVQAKFGDIYYKENSKVRDKMPIVISSNESDFFGDFMIDFGLEPFQCLPSYCHEDESPPVKYISHLLEGMATHFIFNTTLSIAGGAWQLNTPALLFKEIPEILKIDFHVGWIGLGTGLRARENFKDENPIFSIIYDFPTELGSIIFGFDTELADLSKPTLVLRSDSSWQMQIISISVGDSLVYFNDTEPIPVSFDLVDHNCLFPEKIRSGIRDQLESLECLGTHCISETLVENDPIIFTFANGAQLSLGPEIYLKKDNNDQVFYHPIPLYPQRTNKKKPQITLGSEILKHFYSVFQLLNGVNTITLYSRASNIPLKQKLSASQTANSTSEIQPPSDSSWLQYIIFGMIGVCLVGLLIVGSWRRLKSWFRVENMQTPQRIDMELSEQESEGLTLNT